MKLIVLISAFATLAWAAPANETVEARFSPFRVHDERFALGTFAKLNWYQAQATCASHGYTLVSINSEFDQRRVRNFFYTKGHSLLHLLNEPIWTSGTDLPEQNNWIWMSNGLSLSYRNFVPGAPGSSGGNCLGINGVTSTWVNEDCRLSRYFVCERSCATLDY